MFSHFKRRLTLAAALLAFVAACAVEAAPVRVAVIAFALPKDNVSIAEATKKALQPVFGKRGIELVFCTFEEFDKEVKSGRADIVLGTAGHVRRLNAYGLRAVATIVKPPAVNPNRNEGTAIVVRRDRTDLMTLGDLKGTVLAANNPLGFTGYQIAMSEIARFDIAPEDFFSRTIFTGDARSTDTIAQLVVDGKADVGFLRLCAYETFLRRHPEHQGKLRVLEPRLSKEITCAFSTELYPSFTIAVTSKISPAISREITMALLSMPPTSKGSYWSVPTNFQSVDRVLETLKIGPYAYLRERTLKDFLHDHYPWFILAACFILGLILHSWRADVLARRRGNLIRELMANEMALNEKLANMQRSGTVTQLSSMFAHELRQPLTTVALYSEGLARQVKKGVISPERIVQIADKIADETHRASDIVESVRGYAKGRTQPRTRLDLRRIMSESVRLWQAAPSPVRQCRMQWPNTETAVLGNEMELELVFVNLLKNAREAVEKQPNPTISFSAQRREHSVEVTVADSGPAPSEEKLAELGTPAVSAKTQGLGLGLSIVSVIVESHGGTIRFEAGRGPVLTGLCVTVTLPLIDSQEAIPS